MTSSFLHSLKLEMYSSPWCVFFQPSSSFCSPWVPVDSLSLTMEEIRIWGLFCLWSCRCLLASCWMNFGMGTKDGRLFLEKAISVEWVDVLIQLLRGIRDAWGIQKLADLCSYLDIKALILRSSSSCWASSSSSGFAQRWAWLSRNPGTWKNRRAEETRHSCLEDGKSCLPALARICSSDSWRRNHC